MSGSQKGTSTVLLIFGVIITISAAFIAFKLYFEPARNHKEMTPAGYEVITKDSFSHRSPETMQSHESQPASSAQTSGLTNPASENCVKEGGTLQIMTNGTGGQFGLCQFEDDQACEEWALMRGQCPAGGVKTIGYDNNQQAYCAWLGGKTEAVENAACTLPDGKTCSVEALWNGQCS